MFTRFFYVRKLTSIWVSILCAPYIFLWHQNWKKGSAIGKGKTILFPISLRFLLLNMLKNFFLFQVQHLKMKKKNCCLFQGQAIKTLFQDFDGKQIFEGLKNYFLSNKVFIIYTCYKIQFESEHYKCVIIIYKVAHFDVPPNKSS